jgi:GTP pyrophosphokinase
MTNTLALLGDLTKFEVIFAAMQRGSVGHLDVSGAKFSFQHGLETALILEGVGCDKETLVAALLFSASDASDQNQAIGRKLLESEGFSSVWPLISSLNSLRSLRAPIVLKNEAIILPAQNQLEVLRRMLLAMVSDERVALIYLASALQQFRKFVTDRKEPSPAFCVEALQVLSPLANRLGLWQLKWEIEDLAFRFSDAITYKLIAKQLEEKRQDRTDFIEHFQHQLSAKIAERGIKASVAGRPKHIYSIHKKMLAKNLPLDGLSDLHAFRVLVESVRSCYSVLAVVHESWASIASEYDDYIARPKPNGYQSLHTVVRANDGRPVEIQIRTNEMHQFAEYGVASHWRYKENTGQGSKVSGAQSQEARVAAMRQILAWQNDVAHTIAVPASTHVYAMTPQGRVIELPSGSTPVDFAYHVHSDLGHRCRGAKVNDQLVPLTTPLENGQTVEILASKAVRVTPAEYVLQADRHSGSANSGQGARIGPSRDWLNPQLGFLVSARAKTKVRQWFNAIEELMAARVPSDGDVARPEASKPVHLHGDEAAELLDALNKPRQGTPNRSQKASDVLVVGVDFLMTQLAKCCRPLPPDDIDGFVTRGHGISIHRRHCKSFKAMIAKSPERELPCTWGQTLADENKSYPVDIQVHAYDRQGLLRDITDTLAREKINVTAASTQSKDQIAYMRFTVEVSSATKLTAAIASVMGIQGVFDAKRRL